MKHHVVTQHKDEEDFQYECRECGKFFDTADQLAKHSKIVHGEKKNLEINFSKFFSKFLALEKN